ncbi:MAG: TolC family protein [Cytophagaceae bacterium]
MNRYLFFIIFYLVGQHVYAQQSHTLTLDQCVEYALKNQADVQNAALDVHSAKSRVGEIRAIGLPQANGSVQITDNPRLQRMFLTPENASMFFPPGQPIPTDVVGIENLFQLRSSGDANITLSQLIFDGSYFVGLQAASVYRELAQKSLTRTEIEVAESVTKAYYMVLINEERTNLLDNNLARLDTLLRETRAMHEQGLLEKIEVSRIQVNYNNMLVEKQRFDNMKQIGLLMLKFQMGMPMENELIPAQSLNDFSGEFVMDTETPVNYNDRIEYSMQKTTRNLNALDIRNERIQSLPRLSAFASGGFFTQHTSVPNLFGNPWYGYGRYGLTLNVPIFDGLGRVYRIQQAKVSLSQTENNIRNLENAIDFQVRQSRLNLQSNLEMLEAQRRNLELAEEVTRISRIKYQEGVGSNLEVTTAENSYREAQTNYFNSLYDVLVATVDYKKSLGTLNVNKN